MNTVPNESTCPKCGQPVSLNAFEGLCPACLLQAGFGTITGDDGAEKLSAFIPPTPEELAKHFPQLEIIELLGRGGMGAVYKARQIHLDRIVALKILPPAVSQAPAFAERFVREAKALAKLHHPNIVTLYESGQADDLFYFLMEFVDGVNLRQLLSTGTISSKDALAIVPQICDALQFAHDRGIVHRDIKPENILLSKSGQVKIADFGIAKIVTGEMAEVPSSTNSSSESSQTEIGKVLGTPQYMAPEQLSHPLDVDNRADIYALGVVFYQMLTGELPVGKFEPPSTKVQIDVRLDEIVLRALARQPELRYQQASAMKTQVETIVGTPPIPAVPAPPLSFLPAIPKGTEVSYPPRFSRTAIVGAALLPFCLIVAGLLFLLTHAYHPDVRGLTLVSTLFAFLCLGVILGTTLLGWIAVFRIRHSGGRLSGLELALFDGLLFPLLFLDALLASVVNGLVNTVGDSLGQFLLQTTIATSPTITLTQPTLLGRLFVDHRPELAQVVSLVLAIVIDWFVIRRVWRAVNRPPYQLSSVPKNQPLNPPPAAHAAQSSTNASPILVPILRWFLVAFATFVLTVLGGALITFQFLPKVYTATSLIQIHPQGADPEPERSVDFNNAAWQAEFEIIQSPDVLLPVIQDLNLDTVWAKHFNKSPGATLPPLDTLAYLHSVLRIALKRGTNIVEINVSSDQPQEAAQIANAVVDQYKTLRNVQENQRNQRGEAALHEQIAQQQKVVDEKRSAAASLLAGLQQKNISIPADTAASGADLNARKKYLLAAQEDYDARRVLLASVIDLPDDQFISTLKGLGREQKDLDPLGTRIAELQTDIPNLERDGLLATNPRILALQAELTAKQKQRAEMVAGLRRAMKVDTEMAKSRVTLLQNEVTNTKPSPAISPTLTPYLTARRELVEQESLLDALTVRIKQVTTDRRRLESPVIIISRAEPPAYPSKPNTRLNLLLSALAGILLGIIVASALEFILWSRRSSTTTKPTSVPPSPSSPTPLNSQNGKRLALAGTILQPLSILLMIASGIWQIHVFSTLSAHGPANLDTLGAALSQGVIASTTATVLFFVSLIFLSIALAVSRYRERWFFTFLTIYSWPLLLIFPFGTLAALFFLIYCLTHRNEFSTPSDCPNSPAISSAVSGKFPWGTLALVLCLGALPAMFAVGALLHGSWKLVGVGTLLLEIAALVLGLISWRSTPGKIAAILSGLLLLASVPAGIFIATLMRAAVNTPGLVQSDIPPSPSDVAITMWKNHQWQDEITRQLQPRSERFDKIAMNLNPNESTAIFAFTNLQEMKGVNGQNVWTPIDGTLIAHDKDNGTWQVTGTGQLGAVQFTLTSPDAIDPILFTTPSKPPITYTGGTWTAGGLVNVSKDANNWSHEGRLYHARVFQQTTANSAQPAPHPYQFIADIRNTVPNSTGTVSLPPGASWPTNPITVVTPANLVGAHYLYIQGFDTMPSLLANFPNGIYGLNITHPYPGNIPGTWVPLSLTFSDSVDFPPDAPVITNTTWKSGSLVLDPASAVINFKNPSGLTATWEIVGGGRSSGGGDTGMSALNLTNMISPGQTYQAQLRFIRTDKSVMVHDSSAPDGGANYTFSTVLATIVEFTITTPPAPALPAPPSPDAQKYDALFTPPPVGSIGQIGHVMEIHATSSRPLASGVVAVHYFSQIVGKDAGVTRGDEIAVYGLPATFGEGGSWKGLVYPAVHKTFGQDRFTVYATTREQAIALLESEPEKDR